MAVLPLRRCASMVPRSELELWPARANPVLRNRTSLQTMLPARIPHRAGPGLPPVGTQLPGGALVEHWNRTAWKIVANPGGSGTALKSISAISSSDVWATGCNSGYGDIGFQPPAHRALGRPTVDCQLGSGQTWRQIWKRCAHILLAVGMSMWVVGLCLLPLGLFR